MVGITFDVIRPNGIIRCLWNRTDLNIALRENCQGSKNQKNEGNQSHELQNKFTKVFVLNQSAQFFFNHFSSDCDACIRADLIGNIKQEIIQ